MDNVSPLTVVCLKWESPMLEQAFTVIVGEAGSSPEDGRSTYS